MKQKKKELIKLSREKGFISSEKLIDVYDNYYYLWMCELQQWLRISKKINVFAYPILMTINDNEIEQENPNYSYVVNVKGITQHTIHQHVFESYKNALECGLQEALKLIK